MHVGLFDAQDNLPGDSDAIEEVVDEAHVVYHGVDVTGAQHQQRGDQLGTDTLSFGLVVVVLVFFFKIRGKCSGLTVKISAGMGVQRSMWIIPSTRGR